jgi:hypothetical protein
VEHASKRLGIGVSNAVLASFRRLRPSVGKGRGRKVRLAVPTGYPRRRAPLRMEKRDRAPRVRGLLGGLMLPECAGELNRIL